MSQRSSCFVEHELSSPGGASLHPSHISLLTSLAIKHDPRGYISLIFYLDRYSQDLYFENGFQYRIYFITQILSKLNGMRLKISVGRAVWEGIKE